MESPERKRGMVMANRRTWFTALGGALAVALLTQPAAARGEEAPASTLRLVSSRVTLAGTSNIHPYTASTTAVRVVRVQVARGVLGEGGITDAILRPGGLEVFELAIPAATLSSPKEGLDKNMHKALKVTEHPEIAFRLLRLEAADAGLRGVGVLKIAGVEREVTLALKARLADATVTVTGELQLLMTDFGITPPKAMLGMLKTDPKVTVTFDTVLGVPLT
jgi:hypothetical protein